ncbi:MAG: TonB-dependent receptor [Bacteroidetes bacterium]|nr:TonB-dependent receptor [Bacteroidota bacterium]
MKILKTTLLFLLLGVSIVMKAQSNTPDTAYIKSINLDEVIISATKTPETLRTVAQQMLVLRSRDIADLQSQNTADLLSNSGAAFVQKSQQGGGSPVLRGFEASRILLVIDGVRMNNIVYRAGHLQNIITLDNAILDRAEIVYGPASTIYGSDALGGVVHLYTRNPLFSNTAKDKNIKTNALLRYGSVNNEFTGHVDFNIGLRKFASLTSFTYSNFGDLKGGKNQNPFYSNSYGERPYYVDQVNGKDSLVKNCDRYLQVQSGYTQYDILQKFAFKQNERLTHNLNVQFSNSGDVPRYDRLTDPAGESGLAYAKWYYGPQKRFMAAYDGNYKNTVDFFQDIHVGANLQKIEESRVSRKFGSSKLNSRIENITVAGMNIDFQRSVSSHKLRLGMDAQYNILKSTANSKNITTGVESPLDTRYPDGDNTLLNAALYVSHTWQINDQLVLNDGARLGFSKLHSTINDNTFFNLPVTSVDQSNPVYSGSIGLINNPSDDLKLSILVSTGFRVPDVDDLSKIFETGAGSVIVPNPDLKPEQTINTELGVTKIFNNRTRWENTVYYTHFVDAIVTEKFTINGQDSVLYDGTMSQVYANQNKGEAYIYGFSSNLKSQLSDYFRFSFMMNYTYGRIKTDGPDTPLDHIPPFMARMSWEYSYKNFSSLFFVNYNSWKKLKNYYLGGEDNEQYAVAGEGMPAWFTVNLHASYKLCSAMSLQAGVDNIFDTQYRTFASGINGPGRNVFVSLRGSF